MDILIEYKKLSPDEGMVVYLCEIDQTHEIDRLLIEQSERFEDRAVKASNYRRRLFAVYAVQESDLIGPIELFQSHKKATRAFHYRCEAPDKLSGEVDHFHVYPRMTGVISTGREADTPLRKWWRQI